MRIRDVYPESQIPDRTVFHPGSWIRPVSIQDPGSASKNLSSLTPKKTKKWFLSSRKYDPSCSSRIPIRMLTFYSSQIPDPGSRCQKGTCSRIPANHPPPPEYLLTQDSCKETSPPLLHTTTLHSSTRVHKTTFLGPNGTRFARAISGPKKVSIFRAHPFQCPS